MPKSAKVNSQVRKLEALMPAATAKRKKKQAAKQRLLRRKSKRVTHNQIMRIVLKRIGKTPEYLFVPEKYNRKVIRIYNAVLKEFLVKGYEVPIPDITKMRVEVRIPKARKKLPNHPQPADIEAQLYATAVRPLKNAAKLQNRMEMREEEGAKQWAKKQPRQTG